MFMPTEIVVITSLALTLLLVAGVWSEAAPDMEESAEAGPRAFMPH
jgi:hypothetical protein